MIRKYFSFLVILMCMQSVNLLFAQEEKAQFFSSTGEISPLGPTDDLNYALAFIDHRADDVVWARIVYRMVDLRDAKNNALYYPLRPNVDQRSLFKVMIDAVVEGIPVYRRNARELRPDLSDMVMNNELPGVFAYDEDNDKYLILYDSLTNSVKFDNENYQVFVRDQFRYIIQEVIYFDKHLSRFHTKIIAIAPVKLPKANSDVFRTSENEGDENETESRSDRNKANAERNFLNDLRESVVCWFLFNDLRPYMASQQITQTNNSALRISYDDFFSNKYYNDYLIGDNNLFNKLYSGKEPVNFSKLKKDIRKIEDELLEIETSIWEY